MDSKTTPVRHFVAFRYADGTGADTIRRIEQAFCALPNLIPGIVAMEHGQNNSPENSNHGFTHTFLLTFENAAVRDIYLPHPAHAAFGSLLKEMGVVADVFVFDYHPSSVR